MRHPRTPRSRRRSRSRSPAPSRRRSDDFDDAITLRKSVPVDVTGTLHGARVEPGEPGGHEQTVWYRWVPRTSADLMGRQLCSAMVDVYVGADLASLARIANLPGCTGGLHVDAGQTYWLQVSSLFSFSLWGPGDTFRILLDTWRPPPNDDFTDAVQIGELPVTVFGASGTFRGR